MPAGQFFIKIKSSYADATIYERIGVSQPNADTYVDAYATWGVSLSDGAIGKLTSFVTMKEPVVNNNPTAHGVFVIPETAGRVGEQIMSVPMHITAPDFATFLTRRSQFGELLKLVHPLEIRARLMESGGVVTYSERTVYYTNCSEYRQFLNGMAKFVLTLHDPAPNQ